MAAHLGIELSPGVCRIVDLDVRRHQSVLAGTTVRRFAVYQQDVPELTAVLAEMRGRTASVIVWGAPGDHRQVMVTAGTYDAMRLEARRALAQAGVEARGALIDIAPAPRMTNHPPATRRPVVVALASRAAVTEAVRSIRAAGLDIDVIATPATALASLARVRRSVRSRRSAATSEPDDPASVEAYVAIEERATCIALMRNGSLVAARELTWGFLEGRFRRHLIRLREEIATRLIDELADFVTGCGGSRESIHQVTLCGGVPDVRSLAALLTEQLDIEVEPLDSLFGVDNTGRDEAALRERCPELWLPWAVAVDRPAPLSLLHAQQRRLASARLARAAIAAGILAGVGMGWQVAHSPLIRAQRIPQRQVAPAREHGRNGTVARVRATDT